jgi:hypothetical protein
MLYTKELGEKYNIEYLIKKELGEKYNILGLAPMLLV